MSMAEAAFAPVKQFLEGGDASADTFVASVDSYVEAWQDLVRQTD